MHFMARCESPDVVERLDGAFDQIFARLDEHLDGHVIGNVVLLNQQTVEGELGVRRGGKADLDLLETALHERLKQFQLLGDVHGNGERLVAVTQVHAAPDGRGGEGARRPLTIGQSHRREGPVFGRRIF